MILRPNASTMVAPVMLLATAAALFRVYTAPDRIQKQHRTAQEVCEKSGGQWVVDNGRPICSRS
jgi:hypothetical protein